MSFFDNAKRAFSSKYDEFYDDDRDFEEYEDEYDEEPKRPLFSFLNKKEEIEDEYDEEPRTYRNNSSSAKERFQSPFQKTSTPATPMRTSLGGVTIAVHYPESFNDASKIIREVKANKITIIDISTITSDEEARRIVDYIGGASEGMDCSFKRLCPSIFCFAPKGVDIELNKQKY